MVCCRCGRIADFPGPSGDPDAAASSGPDEKGRPGEAETGGFVIDYRKTVYYGLCRECAEASGEVPPERASGGEAGPGAVL
jgi:Fe2+ or Zn2+ uptake regulation protein